VSAPFASARAASTIVVGQCVVDNARDDDDDEGNADADADADARRATTPTALDRMRASETKKSFARQCVTPERTIGTMRAGVTFSAPRVTSRSTTTTRTSSSSSSSRFRPAWRAHARRQRNGVVADDDDVDEVKVVRRENDDARTATMSACVAVVLSLCVATTSSSCAATVVDEDPIEPFGVYGTVEKEFSVNVMDENGTKIIGRKRGMTVKSCVNIVPSSRMGVGGRPPAALRPAACAGAETLGAITSERDMLPACAPACKASCARALREYDAGQRATTGFGVGKRESEKVLKSCVVTCGKDCTKPGKFFDYIIPFRF